MVPMLHDIRRCYQLMIGGPIRASAAKGMSNDAKGVGYNLIHLRLCKTLRCSEIVGEMQIRVGVFVSLELATSNHNRDGGVLE
jgi:hypothetical protein